MQASTAPVTFLFTDIEGSTRLWERTPDAMRAALASHDALGHAAVTGHRGRVVKTTGDGIHAVFDDPLDAIAATIALQQALADPAATAGVGLLVRCGVHLGVDERRDDDFYGRSVNRAARIMSAAHGGQILVSEAVAVLVRDRLPKGVTLRDLGSVRLRDLASPEQIFQVVHPALRESFPALRSLEATPNNLPQQVTSFIGRENELKEVKRLLAGTRLLTLVGPGGIGKTRLSLQAAADVQDDYPDGVWFVELAPLTNPRLVDQAVAIVLGVKDEAGQSVTIALVNYVKDKRLLLVLDNCEHLIDASARLAKQLLQSGAGLRILASSREPLRVAGETDFAVPALATPEPGRVVTLDSIGRYAATNLFGDRAAAAQPAFRISDRNAVAVADICHRLDGIPLAIELAAARVRTLPVEAIAARLGDRFRLLAGGDRTALPRQQTLRALIDWSYDLLTEREQMLFRRLAVFAGSWTLEAAESVGSGGDLDAADVLELLTRLVEKSLVTMDAEGGRYRLLESVRQYAQEKLADSDEEGAAHSRHLAFFLALAEQASSKLVGPAQGTWLARLDLEGENLLAAHEWCDHADDGATLGLRFVHALKLYMIYRGLLALLHRAAVEALARDGAALPTLERCRALHAAGQASFYMGRYDEAHAYLTEGLAIAQRSADRGREARILEDLGSVAAGQRDLASAHGYLERALIIARQQDNQRVLAGAITGLAQLCRLEDELDKASSLYEEVLVLARTLDDRETIAIALLNLTMVSIARGAHVRAFAMLAEAFAIADDIGSKPAEQSALEVASGFAAWRGEWERAARWLGAADAQGAQTGHRREPADDAFLLPLFERARAALGAGPYASAMRAGHALGYAPAVNEAKAWLGSRPPAPASAPR